MTHMASPQPLIISHTSGLATTKKPLPSNSSIPTNSSPAASQSISAIAVKPSPSENDDIRLRYKLAPPTFRTLSGIQKAPDRRAILQTACRAIEFRSFPIKQAEKGLLREINDHTAIPYPIGEPVSQPWHKIFLLVQIDLSRLGWPNKISASGRQELLKESGRIYHLLDRVIRSIVDLLGLREDGRGVTVALDVLRSIKAKVWEGNEMELLQIDGIGAAKMRRLADAGVKSIKHLASLEFFHIERLLSRNPPFGHQMLQQLSGFPLLCLDVAALFQHAQSASNSMSIVNEQIMSTHQPLWLVRVVLGYQNETLPTWCQRNPWVTLVIEAEDGRLLWFWRGSVKRLDCGKTIVVGLDVKKGDILTATCACEGIVGTIIRTTFTI